MTKTIAPFRLRAALLLVALVSGSCATPGGTARKYPPRSSGCELSMYSTPVPGVAAWDDLGIAEAACNINESTSECIRGLRAEACRMGGDIVYNVPRKPLRPRDQVLLYRGQVAHTRAKTATAKRESEPPEATEAIETNSARPVIPLASPLALPSESAGPAVPLSVPDAAPPARLDLGLHGGLPGGAPPRPARDGGVDSGASPTMDAKPSAMPAGERG